MWPLILSSVVLIIAIVLALIEKERLRLSRKYKHIAGVKELPVIGNRYTVRPNQIQEINIIFHIFQPAPISKAFIMHKLAFLISDPDVFQQMFTSGNTFCEHPYLFDLFRVPYGIITAHYKEWKPVRKASSPAFSNRMALSFIPVFQKHFLRYCDELKARVDGETFDVNHYSLKTSIGVIMETNFDQEVVDEDFKHELFEGYLDNVSKRIFWPMLHLDFTYKFSKLAKDDKYIMDKFYEIFGRTAKKRLAKLDASKQFENQENNNAGWRRLFIDEILRHCKDQDYEKNPVLIENMFTIFMAGYDTTALTVSNVILMLAMHPEIDKKLERELNENYKPGDEIDQELFKRLPYLDCCMKEALRLFPPAPLSVRTNMEDVTLNKIGFVEKGTIFGMNFYSLHRWKHIWGEDAEQFNPDRFLPENSVNRHPYAYLPFSGGARTCLGYQYGICTIKTGLINILTRYKFSTDLKMEDLVFKFSVTMKLVTKHLVRVHERKRNL